jgi:hypothetical protein
MEGTYGDQHVSCVGCEVNDCVWRTSVVRAFVAAEVVMTCQGVETLATVCKVCLESKDTGTWVREVGQVDVEDLVAAFE